MGPAGIGIEKICKKEKDCEGKLPCMQEVESGEKKSSNYVVIFCTYNPLWKFLEMLSFSLTCILDYDFSGWDTCRDCPQVKSVWLAFHLFQSGSDPSPAPMSCLPFGAEFLSFENSYVAWSPNPSTLQCDYIWPMGL